MLDAVNEHKNWLSSTEKAYGTANRQENFHVSSQDVYNKHKAFVDVKYKVV